ncbi:type I restriction enzyme S subunit [Chryseobacterium sp. PvR013]|uniref:restriction endonuclease subunit S n=1 Tax=Chryseobacterium sp. PvR013 TaxID=2806595 RepID=UPI001AE1FDCC|nr:restriction endonuclease subunit S [Chryseobacterium sp. PvR013]MBP1167639.1 type I restriction enzyme S subunit [Chryseobacterium sp. PvR013]
MVKENKMVQTEIGLLPEDWEIVDLGSILLSNPDYGINASAVKYSDTLPTYLRITDIDDGGNFIKDNLSSVNDVNSEKYYLSKDEIVFARTGASVGKTYLYKENDGKLVFAGFLIRLKVNTKEADSKFIFYNTQTTYYKNWIISNSMRSGQPGINSNEIKGFQIPLPPLPEQEAIAEALSDADAWIASLEQLIDKKRLIKQGAMHELLTPKEDWEVKNLGENFVLKARIGWQGLTTSEYKTTGDYYLITGTDFKNGFIDWDNCVFVEKIRFDQDRNIQIKIDDVLITKDGTIGKVAYVDKMSKPTTLNSGVFVARPKYTNLSSRFFYYILMSFHFDEFLNRITAGSTIIHLYQKDFVGFNFPCPKSLFEQNRIATILSDMDAELDALEAQLGKARKVKQGMMQELLTGRVRLV